MLCVNCLSTILHFFENPYKPRQDSAYNSSFTLQNDSTVICCALCECLSLSSGATHTSNTAPLPAGISMKVRYKGVVSNSYKPLSTESGADRDSSGELPNSPSPAEKTYSLFAEVIFDEPQSTTWTTIRINLGFAGKDCIDAVPKQFCSHQSSFTILEELPLPTESNFNRQMATDWYQKCQLEHRTCQHRDLDSNGYFWVPTRLIHLDGDHGIVKLIETDVHCFSADRNYTALSYRWPNSSTQVTTLTKSNMAQLKRGIPTSSLQNSVRDAIEIAHCLGFSYLWVDALCIRQDDKSDWLHESLQMYKVYSNSAITISASGISSAEDGLLRERCPDYFRPSFFIPSISPNPHSRVIITISSLWSHMVDEGLLSTRGWVFQERIASNRILHLGAGSMAWECKESSWIESNPLQCLPIVSSHTAISKPTFWSDLSIGYLTLEGWAAIVRDYTGRKFTKHDDILIAMSGIAEQIASTTKNRSWFLSGMWTHTIAFELPWERTKQDRTLYQQDSGFTHAPSWSWASVQGQVTYPIKHTIKIMDCPELDTVYVGRAPVSRHQQPLISVSNFSFSDQNYSLSNCRFIHIVCCVSTLKFWTMTQEGNPVGLSINGQFINPKQVHMKLTYDCDMTQAQIQASSDAGQHQFVPTFCSHAGCFGIVVTYTNAKAYRRIGSLSFYTELLSSSVSLDMIGNDFSDRVYDMVRICCPGLFGELRQQYQNDSSWRATRPMNLPSQPQFPCEAYDAFNGVYTIRLGEESEDAAPPEKSACILQ